MPTLENRAPELRRSYDHLQTLYGRGLPLQAGEFEALAEVSFRLAVHEETDTAEAFRLLYQAYKLDGTNPKYAYHLGRLYLVHGELDRGAEWLLAAVRLCPTSHRIWSHLSVVQRALDERLDARSATDADSEPDAGATSETSSKSPAKPKYKQGALRQRAAEIAAAVRNGDDSISFDLADVVPPRSLAKFDAKATQRIEKIRKEQGSRRAEAIQAEAERLERNEAERGVQEGARGVRMKHVSAAEAAVSEREGTVAEGRDRKPGRQERNGNGEVASAVRRITNPGTCRWSGIHDLEVDVGCVAEPSPRRRDELVSELEHVHALAGVRGGGGAAFAVLAVEWLLCGYPPGTIRKLSERLDAADPAVVELLERVCELFEVEEAELPRRLAECLERGGLPPTLVALIHHRRLLWRPLTFPKEGLGAYRHAKRFATTPSADGDAEERTREAASHVAALETAVKLLQPRPPSAMDEPDLGSDSGSRAFPDEDGLDILERESNELGPRIDDVFERLAAIEAGVKTGESSPADQEATVEISAFVDDMEQTVNRALATLDALRQSGEVDDPKRLEALEAVYKRFKPRPAGLKKRLRKLESSLHPDAETDSADDDERAPATGEGNVGRVEAAIGRAERAMDENFALAWQTLDAYGPASTRTGPLAALRTLVAGRQAETLYRMGRREEAQRVWYRMLAWDRLNLPVLKNLAVAHVSAGETSQATDSWRSYVEALYFLDVVAGSPRPHADERARVHQACANAYGTSSLLGGAPREGEDLSDIPDLLARRGSVAAIANHRRLEGVNRWLGYRSPTLVLGVSRSTDEESLGQALERQLTFVRDACRLLPNRVREAFCAVSVAHVESAYEESLDVKRRTLKRERYYKDEEGTHLAWIKETIFFKVRVRNAILEHTDWAVTAASGDVIGSLAHVDAIRLDPADDLVCRTAESIGITDPKEYLEQCNDLVGFACNVALQRIFEEAAATTGDSFTPRFAGIVASWKINPIPDEYVDALDDPRAVYAPSVAPAFQLINASQGALDSSGLRTVAEAIDALQTWTRLLPGATGPARALAELLTSVGRDDEARVVLREGHESGFSARGRLQCAESLADLAVRGREFESALELIRELIDENGDRRNLVLLHNAYVGLLNSSESVPVPAVIAADFDRWAAGVADDEASAELQEEALAFKRRLVVLATVATYGDQLDAAGFAALLHELRAIHADDPGNVEARFQEMRALEGRLVAVNKQLSAATGERRQELDAESRSLLGELETAADGVVSAASDPAQRAAAEAVLRALRSRNQD